TMVSRHARERSHTDHRLRAPRLRAPGRLHGGWADHRSRGCHISLIDHLLHPLTLSREREGNDVSVVTFRPIGTWYCPPLQSCTVHEPYRPSTGRVPSPERLEGPS